MYHPDRISPQKAKRRKNKIVVVLLVRGKDWVSKPAFPFFIE